MRLLWLLALCVYTSLLLWSSYVHAPTFNEVGHLPAGIANWRYQRFELYRVNPPLPRMVAAIPVLCADPPTDWGNYSLDPLSRETIPMGIRFTQANGVQTFRLFWFGRLACIPFCLIGAWICRRWATDLWGVAAGWTAFSLWCLHPMVLGHGPLVMPDVPAAAVAVWASYVFWKWLRGPRWGRALVGGVLFGCAQLCKTSLLVMFLLWPVLWLFRVAAPDHNEQPRERRCEFGQLLLVLLIGVYVMNSGYGFKGSFQKLGDFRFLSTALSGEPVESRGVGNRFAGTWLGDIPVPVPADYLQGIDRQKADFESGERSYLRGAWKESGWWYYHLYGLSIKTPSGTLLLFVLAAVLSVWKPYRAAWQDELCLLAPALAILLLVSSQTGFSNHVRYTIPALPFLFVWASRCAKSFALRQRAVLGLTIIGTAATAVASLAAYPHSLSYFNVFAGGPKNGHHHLLDSNVAWGQDLLFLRDWLDGHPEAQPLQLASFGWVDPQIAGIEFTLPPIGPNASGVTQDEKLEFGPQPGWYAVDVNFLHGTQWPAATGDGNWREIPTAGPNYEYFLRFEPVATAGYSIYIYHITPSEANRVRRELGLRLLPMNRQT